MIDNKRVLALILARGGSKRLPRKNVKNFSGKPLIAWTIDAAAESTFIDKTIVSTDSPEIAKIAKQYGATVPFLRPAILSSDSASSFSAIEHAILFLRDQGGIFDIIILLQATSPLRTASQIDEALEQFALDSKFSSLISVSELGFPLEWCAPLSKEGNMDLFKKNKGGMGNSSAVKYYRPNGAIYIGCCDLYLKNKTFLTPENTKAYIMPSELSVDIDTESDFYIAEAIKLHMQNLK